MPADTVLVLTHSADHFVLERVGQALARAGARCLRLDTDLFPSEVRLAARFDDHGGAHTLRAGDEVLEAAQVSAVWARKLWAPRLPEGLEPDIRAGCEREIGATLRGWLARLDGVRWVNPLEANALAGDKLRQLRVARELGLRVPRTLVTNDPDEVRAFREEVGPLVTKMLTPLSISMGKAGRFVRTSRVRDEDLADLDGLRVSPMVFQEEVAKRLELRVACVGGEAFVGAIDASSTDEGATDWRGARPDEVAWRLAELDPAVAGALATMLERLGLRYGAADLILTPDGETVFLELNPAGEWGMLERDLGLPIGAALARQLLDP